MTRPSPPRRPGSYAPAGNAPAARSATRNARRRNTARGWLRVNDPRGARRLRPRTRSFGEGKLKEQRDQLPGGGGDQGGHRDGENPSPDDAGGDAPLDSRERPGGADADDR